MYDDLFMRTLTTLDRLQVQYYDCWLLIADKIRLVSLLLFRLLFLRTQTSKAKPGSVRPPRMLIKSTLYIYIIYIIRVWLLTSGMYVVWTIKDVTHISTTTNQIKIFECIVRSYVASFWWVNEITKETCVHAVTVNDVMVVVFQM